MYHLELSLQNSQGMVVKQFAVLLAPLPAALLFPAAMFLPTQPHLFYVRLNFVIRYQID